MLSSSKKAQVTIFVIIGVLIVSAVSLFFYFKTAPSYVSAEFKEVETYFTECINNNIKEGSALIGSGAGYINPPKFEKGSEYMPFSSQLDFFGNAVPYWFYISGNNIMKEQVPSLNEMQKQLSSFINGEIKNCDFSVFESRGYNITLGEVKSSVTIKDEQIDAEINAALVINKEEKSGRITNHKTSQKTKLGKFYKIAREIYGKQKEELFLENYSLDILYLYAPVTKVEISCSPKTWMKQTVKEDLKNALQANMGAIKIEGSYYQNKRDTNYFIVKSPKKVNENVNFLYSPLWETKIDIWDDNGDSDTMIAKPVGNQKGMGILGFCYVPYHFVYDVGFPVMVQVYDEKELFQFPVVVYLEKNSIRPKLEGEAIQETAGICDNKVTDALIATMDNEMKAVEAEIKYQCLNEVCDIGKTAIKNNEAVLETKVPQCIGGTLMASAEGYSDSQLTIDTNEETTAAIIMNKIYTLNVDIFVGGVPLSASQESALITFDSGDEIKTLSYPSQKTIKLKEGYYNISAEVYRTGNLVIGSQKTTQCVKVPKTGMFGFFGMEEEQCYDIEIPSQKLTQLLEGGGKIQDYHIGEDTLKNAKKIEITTSIIPLPKTIMDLQNSYDNVENSEMDIRIV
ncbi:MAG: hypothetical protein V1660_01610 [archaeon]